MKRAIFVITPLLAALLLLLPQRHHAQTLLTGANRPTVQSVVTGSRSFGVAYQNTLTTPMWVNISVLCSLGTDHPIDRFHIHAHHRRSRIDKPEHRAELRVFERHRASEQLLPVH